MLRTQAIEEENEDAHLHLAWAEVVEVVLILTSQAIRGIDHLLHIGIEAMEAVPVSCFFFIRMARG